MRHAFLIMVHSNPEILEVLLKTLDTMDVDIFVHIDKKANFERIKYQPRYSSIFYIDKRIDAAWGDFSLVEIELSLIKSALEIDNYDYLHLISGVDLPVKPINTIINECKHNHGKLFIGLAQNVSEDELKWRSQHYFAFSKGFKNKNLIIRLFRKIHLQFQYLINTKRCPLEIKKGPQWWSITSEFAQYILDHEKEIRKHFNKTYCPDEMVVQTLCWNSEFKNDIYNINDEFKGCRRYIPWIDGELRSFTNDDFKCMQSDDYWFARKFNIQDLNYYEKYFQNR